MSDHTKDRYSIAGLDIHMEDAPDILRKSMNMAFSLSQAKGAEGNDVVRVSSELNDDESFVANMPPLVKEAYGGMDEGETPLAFTGPEGEYGVVLRNGGTASYALTGPPFDHITLRCQRLTKSKGPLHFQTVLIPILKKLLLERGRFLLHSGCVATGEGKGVIVVGHSGSGKTTTCIALAREGMRFLSDDLIVLRVEGEKIFAEGIREKMNLTKRTIDFFPELRHLRDEIRKSPEVKIPVSPEEVFGTEGLGRSAEVRALLIARISKQGPRLEPAPTGEVISELLMNHTFEYGQPVSRQSVNTLWPLIEGTHTFRLVTGHDPLKLGGWMSENISRGLLEQGLAAVRHEEAGKKKRPVRATEGPLEAAILKDMLAHTLDGNAPELSLDAIAGDYIEGTGALESMVKLCRHHRVEAPLARYLCRGEGQCASPAGFDPKETISNAIAHTMKMKHAAKAVTEALASEGIRPMILRGPALAEEYFPQEELRFYRDLDFIVNKDELMRAAEVLRGLGFKPEGELSYWEKKGEWPFGDGNKIIELHWHAYPEVAGLKLLELCGDYRDEPGKYSIDGTEAECLAPEHLLLSSLVHAAFEHQLDRIIRLIDIRQIIKKHGESIDWDWIASRSQEGNCQGAVWKTLGATQAVMDIDLPAGFMNGIRPGGMHEAILDSILPERVMIYEPGRVGKLRRHLLLRYLKFAP
ncbi:MAG: nucleotidyltransferase family protein [Thermodesulfovibrionales bacterium]|nr:nucleotidyltransferase family protein [Thermodesulfovibrionales bacterium]